MHVVYSLRHRNHSPERELEAGAFQSPFEHPGRAEIIRATLERDSSFTFLPPEDHGIEPIAAVHDPGLIRFLQCGWEEYQAAYGPTHDVIPDVFVMAGLRDGMGPAKEPKEISIRMGYWCFETTTPLTQGTWDAARSSVDVALTAADLALGGETGAYGLCRPPGHHASRSLYGGYCFLNNAAITAEHIANRTGGKVTVLDVDYHHGNGTQQIFYDRPDIQVVSLHGDPERAYPYISGTTDETGTGKGAGTTANFPMPVGADDDRYLDALGVALADITSFGPAAVVVSLGLDTYYDDPISDLHVTPDGLAKCGAAIAELGMPTVILQEGGYATDSLGTNAHAWLTGFRAARSS